MLDDSVDLDEQWQAGKKFCENSFTSKQN